MKYELQRSHTVNELVRLYDSVGWSAYTQDPHSLAAAVRNSTFVVSAMAGGELVGLARVLSDDVSIMYLQDVLVNPQYQRAGVGRELLDHCLERFAHVRQRVLLTDDEHHQHRLYQSAGFHDVAKLTSPPLHAFVNVLGTDLT